MAPPQVLHHTPPLLEDAAREARLAQVDVVLELPEHFVADARIVSQTDGGVALDLEKLARELVVSLLPRWRSALVVHLTLERVEALAVVLRQVVVDAGDLGTVLPPRILEVRERGLQHDLPRFEFLAVRATRRREPESPDQRR